MIKPLFYFILSASIISCGSKDASVEKVSVDTSDIIDISEVSNEKKQIVSEILKFDKVIDDRNFEELTNILDTPKRIEDIELVTTNPKLRNAIEQNSSRLSSDVVKEHFDVLFTEMDLNLISNAIKNANKDELLTKNKIESVVTIDSCEYNTEILMADKDVKFNIKRSTDLPSCKKDQQWKFKSNGEYLILDRRYYL